ncbi:HET-domain-containing protein [Cenococcum geophilum 1.58]|uniref:HET-domain-containing protein n=1 Tax=Cenococcum geophilum 1.58 TaxID=794803 RepID=UPI00358FD14B|nr:HET-domain-containing protein [Cenococcum geophilum 1.58]
MPPLLPVPSGLAKPGDKLCDICKALKLGPKRFIVHQSENQKKNKPDKADISLGQVTSIRNKSFCPLCRLVIASLGGTKVPDFEDDEPVCVVMSWNTNGPIPDPEQPWNHIPQIRVLRPYAKKVGGGFVREVRLNMFPEITLLANDAPVSEKTFLVRLVEQEKIDFDIVRNWMSICKSQHGAACNKAMIEEHEKEHPADEVPAFRCIDVVEKCLVRPKSGSKYVALSYIWGRREFFRTLRGNVASLEQPRAFEKPEYLSKIPPTIRDAMEVTREIGIRYLWADSLCIVQDDETDEKKEAIKKMDLVYGAAYLVIIAATGDDAYVGLPGVRPDTRGRSQIIEEIAPGFRLAFKEVYQNYTEDAVYYKRGWTYQENIFSRRSLVFIGGQVIFRCSGADQWREDIVFEDENGLSGDQPRRNERSGDIGEFEGLFQDFSERVLTYQSDIYNAFAGISRYTTRGLKTNLCHGIPEAYFDWFLLWDPLGPQERRGFVPSWSWMGWMGGGSWSHIWDWYSRSTKKIRRAQRQRTWIIWYERTAHDSEDCTLLWRHDKGAVSNRRNFYGASNQPRFPFDCSKTRPTPRTLVSAPENYEDILYPYSGSGFLQFWTVLVSFKLDTPISPADEEGPANKFFRAGIFGRSRRELGIVFLNEIWASKNVPGEHEFILLCEGRDERPEYGKEDEEDGWRYKAMLIEWHGQWAERVAVGSIGKGDWNEAVDEGAQWKEIILG